MNQLLYLMEEHLPWISRGLTLPCGDEAEQSADPEAADCADLSLVGAMNRLILLLLQGQTETDSSPVIETPVLPDQPALAKQADRIVSAGQGLTLSELLRATKEVRRRALELVLWSDLEPEEQVRYRRAAMSAYDQLELLTAQAWERAVQAQHLHLGEAEVLQAMHYPVLIVDVSERIRWLNEATLTLWRALQGVSPDEPRPMYLDEMIPRLALPWDNIVDPQSGEFSRARFEQTLETHSGTRDFVISAWPLPTQRYTTPCVALFLLDRTA